MRVYLTILSFLICFQVLCQDAKDILKKAADLYSAESPIELDFTINTQNVGDDFVHSQNGIAFMSLNKFKINIPEAIAWFDGSTQWIYVKDLNEVNITTPTGADLMGISPMVLLRIYDKGYKVSFVGQTENTGSSVYEIAMNPEDPNVSIGVIHLQIDKKTYRIKQIKINNNGLENTFLVRQYRPNSIMDDSVFVFNPVDYPQAEIVDLRSE